MVLFTIVTLVNWVCDVFVMIGLKSMLSCLVGDRLILIIHMICCNTSAPIGVDIRKHGQSVFFLTFIMSGICLLSNLTCIDRSVAKVATDNQVTATTNFTDQSPQQ